MDSFEFLLTCSHTILFKYLNGKIQIECQICKEKIKVYDVLRIPCNLNKLKNFEFQAEMNIFQEYKSKFNLYKIDPEFYMNEILDPVLLELDLRREKLKENLNDIINEYYFDLRNKINDEFLIRKEYFNREIEEIEVLEKEFDKSNLLMLKEINKRLKNFVFKFTEKKYEFNLNKKEPNVEELFGKLVEIKQLNKPRDLKIKLNLFGHKSWICDLKIIENRILSASWDKSIKLWNSQTGELLNTFIGHMYCVNCICVIHNDIFASGSMDNTIKIWNISTQACQKTIKGHLDSVDCLKLLKNGHLISGSSDFTIKKWDYLTGICLITFVGHSSMVKCLEENNDEKIISGSYDKTIRIWDHNGGCLKIIEGHSDFVCCLLVINNSIFVSGSNDKTIKIWNLNKDECVHVFNEHSDSISGLINFKNNFLISSTFDGKLKIWNLNTGVCKESLKVNNHSITCLSIDENRNIFIGSNDILIRIYNFDEQESIDNLTKENGLKKL